MKVKMINGIVLVLICLLFSACGHNVEDTDADVGSEKQTSNEDLSLENKEPINKNKENVQKDRSQREPLEGKEKEPRNALFTREEKALQLNQEITIVEEENYHSQLVEVDASSINLDWSQVQIDPRLDGLIRHLSRYAYNFEKNSIGQVIAPESLYVLCNKLNYLPEGYAPNELLIPEVRSITNEDVDKRYVIKEVAKALEELFQSAEEEGLYLYTRSGYRSYNTQVATYAYHVRNKGKDGADEVSARAGHSEHQTGLAMDVTCEAAGFQLVERLGELPEGKFIEKHAHEYGLIIRYPKEGVAITGYNYEPWHLRYVGKGVASFLHEHEMTLEELYNYLQIYIVMEMEKNSLSDTFE